MEVLGIVPGMVTAYLAHAVATLRDDPMPRRHGEVCGKKQPAGTRLLATLLPTRHVRAHRQQVE